MTLIIVAQITAAHGKEEALRAELEKLVAPTRIESGCQQYDLHQDHKNAGLFMFIETWDSAEALATHMQTPHIVAFGAATEGMIANFTLNEMAKIA